MNLIKRSKFIFKNRIDLRLTRKCMLSNFSDQNKTLIELVSRNQEVRFIKTVSNFGFRLNNGLFAVGPIVIFNEILLSWNIKCVKEINPASLSFFRMFVPKFDILILGVGDNLRGLHPDLIPWLSKNRVGYEIMNTRDAAKLYNVLIQDKRNVAACLVPPTAVGVQTRPADFDASSTMLEAKVAHHGKNQMALGKIFNQHLGSIMFRMRIQHIATEDMKRQIAAKNFLLLDKEKKMKFDDIIANENRAIIEEELSKLDEYDKPSGTIFEKQEKMKKDKASDDKKLIDDK